MNTVYAREDYLAADEYIDVVRKSGLNRPVEDRGRVERMLAHANLDPDRAPGRQAGGLRPLADRLLLLLLSLRPRGRQGLPGPGHRQAADRGDARQAGGELTTTLLLSAPTAMTFYQGIKMPHADNCFLYRRKR